MFFHIPVQVLAYRLLLQLRFLEFQSLTLAQKLLFSTPVLPIHNSIQVHMCLPSSFVRGHYHYFIYLILVQYVVRFNRIWITGHQLDFRS